MPGALLRRIFATQANCVTFLLDEKLLQEKFYTFAPIENHAARAYCTKVNKSDFVNEEGEVYSV